jgi:hypothetical protein
MNIIGALPSWEDGNRAKTGHRLAEMVAFER